MKYSFLAWGSVAICKDKAVLELTANADGVFEYSLDTEKHGPLNAESYQKCERCKLKFK